MEDDLLQFGHSVFEAPSLTPLRQQSGIVRTNCIDCLDRTNLVQSVFANFVCQQILSDYTPPLKPDLTQTLTFEKLFKQIWADNGDALSIQYAGTGALKGDFTRTGKRETKGKVKDGVNTISRLIINKFRDNLRQMTINLFLGLPKDSYLRISVQQEEAAEETPEIWTEDQSMCLSDCIEKLYEIREDMSAEELMGAWILISVNEWDQEQERVIVVTTKAFYRCKYDFEHQKILRYKRLDLEHITSVEVGTFAPKTFADQLRKDSLGKLWAMHLVLDTSAVKKKSTHIYYAYSSLPAEIRKEIVTDVVEMLMTARECLSRPLPVVEKELTRPSGMGVAAVAFNGLGLGMFRNMDKRVSSMLGNAAPPAARAKEDTEETSGGTVGRDSNPSPLPSPSTSPFPSPRHSSDSTLQRSPRPASRFVMARPAPSPRSMLLSPHAVVITNVQLLSIPSVTRPSIDPILLESEP